MAKRLNFFGKLLFLFTAFFPLYVYWAYFFYTKINDFSLGGWLQGANFIFILFAFFSIASFILFYFVLFRRRKSRDKEISVQTATKGSIYLTHIVASLSPFLLFLANFFEGKEVLSLSTVVAGTVIFVFLGFILIFRDEYGILYNVFFIPYNLFNVRSKDGKSYVIITRKNNLSGYIKVNQLNQKILREWI